MGKKPRKDGGMQVARRASLIDQLMEFEEFRGSILPAIREDIKAGLSADEIRKKYEAVAAAKMVTTMITSSF